MFSSTCADFSCILVFPGKFIDIHPNLVHTQNFEKSKNNTCPICSFQFFIWREGEQEKDITYIYPNVLGLDRMERGTVEKPPSALLDRYLNMQRMSKSFQNALFSKL